MNVVDVEIEALCSGLYSHPSSVDSPINPFSCPIQYRSSHKPPRTQDRRS